MLTHLGQCGQAFISQQIRCLHEGTFVLGHLLTEMTWEYEPCAYIYVCG